MEFPDHVIKFDQWGSRKWEIRYHIVFFAHLSGKSMFNLIFCVTFCRSDCRAVQIFKVLFKNSGANTFLWLTLTRAKLIYYMLKCLLVPGFYMPILVIYWNFDWI